MHSFLVVVAKPARRVPGDLLRLLHQTDSRELAVAAPPTAPRAGTRRRRIVGIHRRVRARLAR